MVRNYLGNRSLLNVGVQGNDMIGSMLPAIGPGGMWRIKKRLENQAGVREPSEEAASTPWGRDSRASGEEEVV